MRTRVDRPAPRGHAQKIAAHGKEEPMTVKLDAWVSNTEPRRDRLTADRLESLRKSGIARA
ncbi:hypothetical protein [Streptomyces sp. JHA26]|uniref:hypothetical protein n=1 Tax=Streptomyces sp. JHA26 TaxID=1917143 RepID=UPI00098B40E4|nr:hypothetical protein [Streptomyces sp. JHA26]